MDRRHLVVAAVLAVSALASGCSRPPAATDVAMKLGFPLKSAPVDVTNADPGIRREGIASRASVMSKDGTQFSVEVYRTADSRAQARKMLGDSPFRQVFVECGKILVFFPSDDAPIKPLAAAARKALTKSYAPC